MAIELSNLTFTDRTDIVPASGVEEISNTGIANTLAGNDIVIGTKEITIDTPLQNRFSSIFNSGTLNTADGNDIITGTINRREIPFVHPEQDYDYYIFYDKYYSAYSSGIYNIGSIYTGEGNDRITGINEAVVSVFGYDRGIYTAGSTIDTGGGDDIITGITQKGTGIESLDSTINTGDGNDTITGTTLDHSGIYLAGTGGIDTGKGNDIITGTSPLYGIFNYFDTFLNTGEGNDIITGNASQFGYALANFGFMETGDGNDIITGSNIDEADGILDNVGTGLLNGGEFDGFMYTGNGNDTITGIATAKDGVGLYNLRTYTIDTGNGNDIIIGTGKRYGIINDGIINTGNGDDSIIANGGFNVGNDRTGSVLLGNGKDYLKGFGSGNFDGGNGKDTLELTSGSYTVGISATGVNFIKDSIIMNTSGFEELIAGNTKYDFNRLTNGQTIVV
ncbi:MULTISPECIES: hypothetical protein [unclassified Microcoleus]|uniref:hypothetical protein n=1 Tax=unclassified Microcoleus TaxID=2642155 RepID=UPI002FCFC102